MIENIFHFFRIFPLVDLSTMKNRDQFSSKNKKVRQPKRAHRKAQTPIVAKQISSNNTDLFAIHKT